MAVMQSCKEGRRGERDLMGVEGRGGVAVVMVV